MSKDNFPHLPKLGVAIDTALAEWESYLKTLTDDPTYEAIISDNIQDITTKSKALLHLLETLPSRHAALALSYSDPDLTLVELSGPCAGLLEELQKPASEIGLKSWFNRTITGKKIVSSISQLEKDITREEQGRAQELRRLKASHLSLMAVHQDGELGAEEVEKLLDAMEAIGVPLAVPGAFSELADEEDEVEEARDMAAR